MRIVSNSHSLAQNTCRKQKANVTFGKRTVDGVEKLVQLRSLDV